MLTCTETTEYGSSTICTTYEISSTTLDQIKQPYNYQDWIFVNSLIIALLAPVALGFFLSPFKRKR